MIAGMTYYQICMYFLIYSFLGWVVEVVFHAVNLGKIVNRGFLNGPVCPVYGFGMLAVLAAGNAVSMYADPGSDVTQLNAGELFLFGIVLATVIELVAGWMLDKLFHARWWDYSDKPFNFHGYICLEFSIIWGAAIVLIVKVLHPAISDSTAGAIDPGYGWPIMAVLYAIYLADLIVTVLTVSGLNKKLKELDRLRELMRQPSDKLTDVIASTSMDTAQHVAEGKVQASLARTELKEQVEAAREARDLKNAVDKAKMDADKARRDAEIERYRNDLRNRIDELKEDISGHRAFGTGRLLKAFPTMKHERYADSVEELKRLAAEKRKKHEEKKSDDSEEKRKAA